MMNETKVSKHYYENREDLYQKVANRCADLLTKDIEQHQAASLIVPGGTTPEFVFEKLSLKQIKWDKVSISPSDERWIDVEHEQSNEKLLKTKLLINNAATAQYFGLKNSAITALEGEKDAEKNIQKHKQPFSLTMLGMGSDGHFASLFPGCEQINEALDISQSKMVTAINAASCPVAGKFTQRISLTLAALLNSNIIIILITGQEKLDVVEASLKQDNKFDRPIIALLEQTKTPVEIHWAN